MDSRDAKVRIALSASRALSFWVSLIDLISWERKLEVRICIGVVGRRREE